MPQGIFGKKLVEKESKLQAEHVFKHCLPVMSHVHYCESFQYFW